MSPNSLMMRASRRPSAVRSRCRIRLVLPAPKESGDDGGGDHGASCGFVLQNQGKPAATKTTRSAAAATCWLSRPAWSRNARPSGVVGHETEPDLVADEHDGAAHFAERSASASVSWSSRLRRPERFDEPEREAIEQHGGLSGARGDRRRDVQGCLHRAPERCRGVPGGGDARRHLGVAGLGGRQIVPAVRCALDQPLGKAALARTRAAQHQGSREPGWPCGER